MKRKLCIGIFILSGASVAVSGLAAGRPVAHCVRSQPTDWSEEIVVTEEAGKYHLTQILHESNGESRVYVDILPAKKIIQGGYLYFLDEREPITDYGAGLKIDIAHSKASHSGVFKCYSTDDDVTCTLAP